MEVRKIIKSERVIEERDHEDDDTMHTILFTAGTALLMVCLKRAMITLLVEQWRAWVFLVLNIVLLAILFTSTRSASNENQQCNNNNVAMKVERVERKNKNTRLSTWSPPQVEECTKEYKNVIHSKTISDKDEPEERIEEDTEVPRLSKEELNERVETFIAMFRQHLISDAKKGRTHFFDKSEGAETLKFQRVSNINLTSPLQGVKCFNVEVKG
jgi:type III secretory pathway component EscV